MHRDFVDFGTTGAFDPAKSLPTAANPPAENHLSYKSGDRVP